MLNKYSYGVVIFIQKCILYFFNFYFKFFSFKKVDFIIGVHEVANILNFFKSIFKERCLTVNIRKNKFYSENIYDYGPINTKSFNGLLALVIYYPYLLAKLSYRSDIFIYLWDNGFCLDREVDYKFLYAKNKKIVCIFLGSDIRSPVLTKDYHKKLNLDNSIFYLEINTNEVDEKVKKVALLADKYANLIFNHPKDQISYLKSKQIQWPYMIDDKILARNEEKFIYKSKTVIIHAPSNPIGKGTPLVRAAIKKLSIEGYEFDYIELLNRPNSEVLSILENSHIAINEFYAYSPGVFSIEAMSKFNVVVTSADCKDIYGADGAWLSTKYWEIYDNLKYLLDNPAKQYEYAKRGYEYIINYCSQENVKNFYISTFYEHGLLKNKEI